MNKKIKLNRENGIQIIDYNTHVTLDKKYVQYSGGIVDMGIRKLS